MQAGWFSRTSMFLFVHSPIGSTDLSSRHIRRRQDRRFPTAASTWNTWAFPGTARGQAQCLALSRHRLSSGTSKYTSPVAGHSARGDSPESDAGAQTKMRWLLPTVTWSLPSHGASSPGTFRSHGHATQLRLWHACHCTGEGGVTGKERNSRAQRRG